MTKKKKPKVPLKRIDTRGLSDEAKESAEQANRMIDRENARRSDDGR